MPIVACIWQAVSGPGCFLSHMPTMFEHATQKSPIDINTIILREFVLKSGHITNVIMIISVPTIDSEAAVVDKTLLIILPAISVWFIVHVLVKIVVLAIVNSAETLVSTIQLLCDGWLRFPLCWSRKLIVLEERRYRCIFVWWPKSDVNWVHRFYCFF